MAEAHPVELSFHRLPDGRRLAWRQTGQGPPLVMLHGWSLSGSVFHEVAAALAGDFQVFCPDLCGHGWSDPGASCSLQSLADDLGDWLSSLDLPAPALLGWSLGGQVAMQLAGQAPSSLGRLLLVSTTPCFCRKKDWPHGLPPAQVRSMGRQLQRAYLKTLGEFFDLQFADETPTAARRREILAFSARASRLPQPDDCLATLNLLGTEDLRPAVSRLACPVLVMHGSRDRIIPWQAGRYLARTIAGARLQLLEGVGHAPFISRPRECVEIWRSFLK